MVLCVKVPGPSVVPSSWRALDVAGSGSVQCNVEGEERGRDWGDKG